MIPRSAFPFVVYRLSPSGENYDTEVHDGMSLRDYFAAAVLTGNLANSDPRRAIFTGDGMAHEADLAYLFADAMLAEREQEP